jgi:hypothetical protein
MQWKSLKCVVVEQGNVTGVEHGWVPVFALLPHRTVSKKWVWLEQVYMRRVWVYTGFVDEPETQYGDLFDILATKE